MMELVERLLRVELLSNQPELFYIKASANPNLLNLSLKDYKSQENYLKRENITKIDGMLTNYISIKTYMSLNGQNKIKVESNSSNSMQLNITEPLQDKVIKIEWINGVEYYDVNYLLDYLDVDVEFLYDPDLKVFVVEYL